MAIGPRLLFDSIDALFQFRIAQRQFGFYVRLHVLLCLVFLIHPVHHVKENIVAHSCSSYIISGEKLCIGCPFASGNSYVGCSKNREAMAIISLGLRNRGAINNSCHTISSYKKSFAHHHAKTAGFFQTRDSDHPGYFRYFATDR